MDIPDFMEDAFMIGSAAGFGYEEGQNDAANNEPDQLDERQLAKDLLKRKEKEEKEPRRISLKARHKVRGSKLSPSVRWMYDVATGQKTTKDPVELTEEEQRAILKYEGEED